MIRRAPAFPSTATTGPARCRSACSVTIGDATDIGQRPPDPEDSLDGKREESIDIKRMIHQIHTGAESRRRGSSSTATDSIRTIYVPHDYSHVGFVGNNRNCLDLSQPRHLQHGCGLGERGRRRRSIPGPEADRPQGRPEHLARHLGVLFVSRHRSGEGSHDPQRREPSAHSTRTSPSARCRSPARLQLSAGGPRGTLGALWRDAGSAETVDARVASGFGRVDADAP